MAAFNPIGKPAWVHPSPGDRIAHRSSGCRSALGRFKAVLVLADGWLNGQYIMYVGDLRTGKHFFVRNSNTLFLQEV